MKGRKNQKKEENPAPIVEEEKPKRVTRKTEKIAKKEEETKEKNQKKAEEIIPDRPKRKGRIAKSKSPEPEPEPEKKAKSLGRPKRKRDSPDSKIDKNEDKKDEEKKNSGKKVKKDEKEEIKVDTKIDAKADDALKAKDEAENLVKKITKGGYAVDANCPIKDKVHVYVSASKAYDATLNQSNVSQNNNKFYIIQLLQDDTNSNNYHLWTRWGRVGVPGQNALKGPLGLEQGIHEFEAKLHDKTVKGDYRILEIVLEDTNENGKEEKKEKDVEDKTKKDFEQSKLADSVKKLIQLIFDLKMMNQQMKEIGYDAKKMPLGKLSKSNIEKGYKILTDISENLKKKGPRKELESLSSDFYSYIPHDFGFQKMSNFILDTEKKVKDKLDMLQSISDIQIATKLLEDASKSENIVDDHYQKLKCKIEPLDKKSKEFEIIKEYVEKTHAKTHSTYSLEILDVFEIEREKEKENFESFSKDIPNKMLLWHGSRLTNYVGILSQGLRIAPPEAPSTGYMFGKGVYFADMVSKSANYCYTSRESSTSLMILCDVALGNMNEKLYADYNANNLPPGKMSTKGCGKNGPDPSTWKEIDGVTVPVGEGKDTNIANGTLMYNEYIVYNVKQIRMKYLLKMKFNYKY